MLINYKNIGDEMSDSDLNAYACFLANNKVLTDSFEIKNGAITGSYGNYEFDLSNASIVDNGILITDETLSNNITVKLSNPTQYATYTLHFSVVRYGDVSILDEPTDNIETLDLTVDLVADTIVNIPLESLQEYDVILFNSDVTIAHNKPEIVGAYVTDLDITANPNIIQANETSILEITATDLEHLPVQNKSIQLLKNNTLLDTLVTDSQGKATYTYTGQGSGKLDFIAKYRSLQSETYVITDSMFYDKAILNDPQTNDNWQYGSNLEVVRGTEYTTISETGTSSAYYRANNYNEFTGDFIIEFDLHSIPNNYNYWLFTGTSDTPFTMSNLNLTDDAHIKLVVTGLSYAIYIDGVKFGSDRTINNRSDTGGLKFRFQLNNNANDLKYSNFVIYPI